MPVLTVWIATHGASGSRRHETVAAVMAMHSGQFRTQRGDSCHKQTGFTGHHLKFNHNTMSKFPLVGKHTRVDCAKCHPGGAYKPITTDCVDCHQDDNPHGDTFGDAPCSNCHSPIDWKKTRFDHSVTGFDLQGRHVGQPCYRCHPNGTELEDDTKPECSFCHTDVHSGQFEAALDAPLEEVTTAAIEQTKKQEFAVAGIEQPKHQDCDRCHAGFDSWRIPFFDHELSRFKLTGKHQAVPCSGCHTQGHFRPIDTACGNCHYNFHEGQFSKECDDCHTTEQWAPLSNLITTRQPTIDSTAPTRRSIVGNATSTISTQERPTNAVTVISMCTMANLDLTAVAVMASTIGQ